MQLKNKLGKFYKSAIINICDYFLPLNGELAKKGWIRFDNKLPLELFDGDLDRLKKFIFSMEEVRQILIDYLGTTEVEYEEVWLAPNVASSGTWHHDSVGHRVKIFVPLSETNSDLGTLLVGNSHMNRYDDYSNTRLDVDERSANIDFLYLTKGDFAIFDTNSIHKGIYGDGHRLIYQLEVNTGLKGVLLPGFVGKRPTRGKNLSGKFN